MFGHVLPLLQIAKGRSKVSALRQILSTPLQQLSTTMGPWSLGSSRHPG
jgi:hypothetical protein